MAYNHKFSTNQSFISAIDVEAKEIVLDGYMFSEQQVVWDIDIDSAGNIHFLRKSSPVAFDNKFVVRGRAILMTECLQYLDLG